MTKTQMWWYMDQLARKRLRLVSDECQVKHWLNRAQDEPAKRRLTREFEDIETLGYAGQREEVLLHESDWLDVKQILREGGSADSIAPRYGASTREMHAFIERMQKGGTVPPSSPAAPVALEPWTEESEAETAQRRTHAHAADRPAGEALRGGCKAHAPDPEQSGF